MNCNKKCEYEGYIAVLNCFKVHFLHFSQYRNQNSFVSKIEQAKNVTEILNLFVSKKNQGSFEYYTEIVLIDRWLSKFKHPMSIASEVSSFFNYQDLHCFNLM